MRRKQKKQQNKFRLGNLVSKTGKGKMEDYLKAEIGAYEGLLLLSVLINFALIAVAAYNIGRKEKP